MANKKDYRKILEEGNRQVNRSYLFWILMPIVIIGGSFGVVLAVVQAVMHYFS